MVTVLAGLVLASPASAAKTCAEPGGAWPRATPGEAGMDAAKLQSALDYASGDLSFAVRVYRHGCLVGEDRLAPANRTQRYESWSMAKSVTALMFGRAMQLGLISPDDPVGSLVPEADLAHGAITMRDLLTMTSGLEWNGFRDYNIFTGFDRIHDALTLRAVHKPGTFFEYAQSPVSLLAEAIGRSAGMDAGAFAQQELMGPLGIAPESWTLDPRRGRARRRLLRGADDPRRLRAPGRPHAPRRRLAREAPAVGRVRAPGGHPDSDQRLLRLAHLGERRVAVRRPAHHRAPRLQGAGTSPTCPPTSTASPGSSGSS